MRHQLAQFRRTKRHVEGHEGRTEPRHGELQDLHMRVIGVQHTNQMAGAHTQTRQAVGSAHHRCAEFTVAQAGVVIDDRFVVGMPARDVLERAGKRAIAPVVSRHRRGRRCRRRR